LLCHVVAGLSSLNKNCPQAWAEFSGARGLSPPWAREIWKMPAGTEGVTFHNSRRLEPCCNALHSELVQTETRHRRSDRFSVLAILNIESDLIALPEKLIDHYANTGSRRLQLL
jgi:hypothetical protein